MDRKTRTSPISAISVLDQDGKILIIISSLSDNMRLDALEYK